MGNVNQIHIDAWMKAVVAALEKITEAGAVDSEGIGISFDGYPNFQAFVGHKELCESSGIIQTEHVPVGPIGQVLGIEDDGNGTAVIPNADCCLTLLWNRAGSPLPVSMRFLRFWFPPMRRRQSRL